MLAVIFFAVFLTINLDSKLCLVIGNKAFGQLFNPALGENGGKPTRPVNSISNQSLRFHLRVSTKRTYLLVESILSQITFDQFTDLILIMHVTWFIEQTSLLAEQSVVGDKEIWSVYMEVLFLSTSVAFAVRTRLLFLWSLFQSTIRRILVPVKQYVGRFIFTFTHLSHSLKYKSEKDKSLY